MRRIRALARCAAWSAALMTVSLPALAADAPADVSPCSRNALMIDTTEVSMPGFTLAQVVEKPKPYYPGEALIDWSEGWVLLEFAVGADGTVRDVVPVDAFGAKAFIANATKTVAKWRYKPATRNGQPVDQMLYQVSVLYLFQDSRREADHAEFVAKYNRARRHIREGQFGEAIEQLERGFKGRLNLYEAAMGSLALAIAYAQSGDWENGIYHLRHATFGDLKYLDKPSRSTALELQVQLEGRAGNPQTALCAYRELQKIAPDLAAVGGPSASAVKQVEAVLASTSPMAFEARLAKHPLFEAPAVWRHRLLRSKFAFDDIKGEVKSFRLVCVGTTHDAAVDVETEWNVPKAAGPCILRVDGAPGATFKLIEAW